MQLIVLKIIGVIVLIIALIMLIPIGVDLAFEGGKLRLSAKIAGTLMQLIPKPEAGKSSKKKKKAPEEKPAETEAPKAKKAKKKKPNLDFSKDELLELIIKALKGFGIFGRKLRVDRFLLDYTAAGKDPYRTAVFFGYVNAALNVLAPICSQRFTVDDLYVHTEADFTAETMKLDFGIALTIRIGAIFRMLLTIAFGALGVLIKHKINNRKQKKASKNNSDENSENIRPNERMNENG